MKNLSITRITISLLSLVTLGCLGVSCNKVEEPNVTPTNIKVDVSAGIESPTVKATALRGASFVVGDQIGLYLVAYLKPDEKGRLEIDGNYVDNAKSTLTTGAPDTWVNSPVLFYPTADASVFAYSPYKSAFKPTANQGNSVIEATADQSTNAKVCANDFMTAKIEKQGSTTIPMALTFYHRLSRIDLKFKVPASFKGKAIERISGVRLMGFKNKASVDMVTPYTYTLDGAATGGTYPKPAVTDATASLIDITPFEVQSSTPGNTATDGTEFNVYEAIVVPQSLVAGSGFVEIDLEFTAAAGGGTEKFFYKVDAGVTQTFEAAKKTLITLAFQADNVILLGAPTIEAWGASTALSGSVVNREVFNTFVANITSAEAGNAKSVKLVTSVGNLLPVVSEWLLPCAKSAADKVSFAFDGTQPSPEFYPFKVTGVKFYSDAAGTTEITSEAISGKTITVSATGAITINK